MNRKEREAEFKAKIAELDAYIEVTMFADANAKMRQARHRSRGLRAPCREASPRCFS